MPIHRILTFAKGLWHYEPGAPDDSLRVAENVQFTDDMKLEQRPALDWWWPPVGFGLGNTRRRTPNNLIVKGLRREFILGGNVLYRTTGPTSGMRLFTTPGGNFSAKDYLEATSADGFTSIGGMLNANGTRDNADVNGSTTSPAQTFKHFVTEKGDYFHFGDTAPVKRILDNRSQTATTPPFKYFAVNAGLPELADDPTFTGSAGANNYIYFFHYLLQYYFDGKIFVEFGPVSGPHEYLGKSALGANTNTIGNIRFPSHWNQGWVSGYQDDINTTALSIAMAIYRTKHNGSVPFFVGLSPANHPTTAHSTIKTFSDNISDGQLPIAGSTGIPSVLYTTGGADDDAPLQHLNNYASARGPKYFTITNNCAWNAGFLEGGKDNFTDVIQSKPLKYGTAPGSYRLGIKEKITGLSHVDIYPIVFTDTSIYRIEGVIDELGAGTHVARRIDSDVGLYHDKSIVQVGNQLYFFSREGRLYRTDGFRLFEAAKQYNDALANLIPFRTVSAPTDARPAVQGVHNPERNTVAWIIPRRQSPSHMNFTSSAGHILELKVDHPDEPLVWMYSSSGGFTKFPYITAITVRDGQYFLGTAHGYLMRLNPHMVDNVAYRGLSDATTDGWGTEPIIPKIESSLFVIGAITSSKWFSRAFLYFRSFFPYRQTLSVGLATKTEAKETAVAMRTIDTNVSAFNGIMLAFKRWFPRTILRSRLRSITIEKPRIVLYASGLTTTATFPTSTTAVIATGSWPPDVDSQFIRYEITPGTFTERQIRSVSGDTLTLETGGTVINTPTPWEIIGFRKGEKFRLEAVELEYTDVGETITP